MADMGQKGIGEELQAARIDKGLTLDDVQAQTKIQKRYLQAIENNQFDQLPGKFYERAFTRQYAAAVGIDADDLLERYDLVAPAENPNMEQVRVDEDNVTRVGMRSEENLQKKQLVNAMPKIIMGVVALAVVIVVWALVANFAGHSKSSTEDSHVSISSSSVANSSSKTSSESSIEKSSSSEDKKKSKDKKKSENKKTEISAPAIAGTTTTFEAKVPADTDRKLTLTGQNGDSWVLVKSNTGVVLYSGTVKSGVNQEFNLNSDVTSVNIQTGNANNLKVNFNDNDLNLSNTTLVWHALINITQK